MRKTVLLLASVALAVLLACGVALAAAGDLDPSFGGDGRVTTKVGEVWSRYESSDLIVQPDGKLVAAGQRVIANSDYGFALTRYNPDGSLDKGFGTNGRVVTGRSLVAFALARQRDGKLVVAGNGYENLGGIVIARYNPDGTLDRSFGGDGLVSAGRNFDAYALDVIVQPDGKIVTAGNGEDSNGDGFALVRFNANGSLDEGFGEGGKVVSDFYGSEGISALALQPNGRLVVAGGAYTGDDDGYDFAVARYNRDGSVDRGFGRGGVMTTDFGSFSAGASELVLQPDGKIVAGGGCCSGRRPASPTRADFVLVRYKPDGSLDGTFGQGGKVKTDFFRFGDHLSGLVLQPDGKIVAAGYAEQLPPDRYDVNFALARYQSDGDLDASFGEGGKLTTQFPGSKAAYANALVRQGDGRLVAAGYTYAEFRTGSDLQFALARYLR